MGGRGSCRAESYRQIVKSANRQVGKRQRMVKRRQVANSEWRMAIGETRIFWRAALLRCRKIFSAHQEMRPSVFQPALDWLRFRSHRFQSVDKRGARLPPSQNGSEWRLAISEWRNGIEGEQKWVRRLSGGRMAVSDTPASLFTWQPCCAKL